MVNLYNVNPEFQLLKYQKVHWEACRIHRVHITLVDYNTMEYRAYILILIWADIQQLWGAYICNVIKTQNSFVSLSTLGP